MKKLNKLNKYLEKCFDNAAENNFRILKPEDYDFRYYIFNSQKIAIVLDCKFDCIKRQVMGRIQRNIKRNFNLDLITVHEYDAAVQGYDPNFCVCKVKYIKKNGKEKTFWISYVREEDLNIHKAPYLLMLELAKNKGLIKSDEEFSEKISWEDLKKLWMEIFNETKFKNLDIITSNNITILG